jgi:predicted PilT family ATPase
MKQDQLVQYQQGISEADGDYNLSLTTPYGPPSDTAYILEVPNECVGLVIGKEGETIKNIARKSGAIKVQVATSTAPGAKTRNIFVEGEP